jgi:hypothetical protein
MKRSGLANMVFYIQSVEEVVILAVIVGILFGIATLSIRFLFPLISSVKSI